jgi:hypothetical protein
MALELSSLSSRCLLTHLPGQLSLQSSFILWSLFWAVVWVKIQLFPNRNLIVQMPFVEYTSIFSDFVAHLSQIKFFIQRSFWAVDSVFFLFFKILMRVLLSGMVGVFSLLLIKKNKKAILYLYFQINLGIVLSYLISKLQIDWVNLIYW